MGNTAIQETGLIDGITNSIQAALPPRWVVRCKANDHSKPPSLVIVSPSGRTVDFGVVMGHSGSVPVAELTTSPAPGMAGSIYVERYISAPVRTKLDLAGISYVDTTGWVHIVSDDPMLAITASGAIKSPKPPTQAAFSRLNGGATGRVIRTLLSIKFPSAKRMTDVAANSESVAFASAPALTVGVRELAKMAQVSPGTVSKILPVLVADGAVVRDSHGYITAVNRRQLLDRWTIDYHVLESNGTPAYFVAPRGIAAILTKLKAAADEALTGAQAGSLWLPEGIVPLVPVTQLVIYTTSTDKSASHLGLVPVDAPAANVILIQPQDPAIIDDPMRKKDIPVAPLPLVLADLLTLPGRYPQQAEALMDALAKTDPAWKS